MKRLCIFSAGCLFFLLPSAQGQLGLYAGFSAAHTTIANEPWFYGATFGGYYNVVKLPFIKIGIDGQAAILNGSGSSAQQKITDGLAGPRAELHFPLFPLKPFVAGHVGASRIEVGEGVSRTDKTVLGYGFAGGADLTIFPRLDWRVVEYSYTRFNLFGSVNQSTFTTGLVIRLPVP